MVTDPGWGSGVASTIPAVSSLVAAWSRRPTWLPSTTEWCSTRPGTTAKTTTRYLELCRLHVFSGTITTPWTERFSALHMTWDSEKFAGRSVTAACTTATRTTASATRWIWTWTPSRCSVTTGSSLPSSTRCCSVAPTTSRLPSRRVAAGAPTNDAPADTVPTWSAAARIRTKVLYATPAVKVQPVETVRSVGVLAAIFASAADRHPVRSASNCASVFGAEAVAAMATAVALAAVGLSTVTTTLVAAGGHDTSGSWEKDAEAVEQSPETTSSRLCPISSSWVPSSPTCTRPPAVPAKTP
mmetsp:Transcript_56684/g.130296  ORF Transcript_56684/g.130296 Transcript_56684/m.130296 type:complete len:299 (+) Transcript_56684:1445-2341(+)